MSTACRADHVAMIEIDIKNWKRLEAEYAIMLSKNDGHREKWEAQMNIAIFMQELKCCKLHQHMRNEAEELTLLSFMYPGCF